MQRHSLTARKKKSNLLAAAIFPVHETPRYELKGAVEGTAAKRPLLLVTFNCFIRDVFSETREKRRKWTINLMGVESCHFQSRQAWLPGEVWRQQVGEDGSIAVTPHSVLQLAFGVLLTATWVTLRVDSTSVLSWLPKVLHARQGSRPCMQAGPTQTSLLHGAYRCTAALVRQPFPAWLIDWRTDTVVSASQNRCALISGVGS